MTEMLASVVMLPVIILEMILTLVSVVMPSGVTILTLISVVMPSGVTVLTLISVVMPSGMTILTIINRFLVIPAIMTYSSAIMSIAAFPHLLSRTTKTLAMDVLIILVFGLFDLDISF